MEAGGENFEAQGQNFIVTTEPHEVGKVRDALEGFGVKVLSAEADPWWLRTPSK